MSCTTLSIECFKAAYTANVGYDSLFCGLKVTCDSNVKYIRAPYVADFNGNTLMLHGWDKSETVIDDVTVTGLSVAQVKDLVATCCCGDDQHLIVNNTPVGYIPTTSGNTSNLNEVVIDSGGDTWIIDINGDARKFNKGTVTSFSAGNLSPLFTTNVATPTTTPALSFNLSNCNQYQVFGRVAAGTGVPSYVSLNPIAFNGLSLPNREVAFGNGTGITSTSNFQFTTGNSLKIGTGTVTGSYGINMGEGSNASNYVLNIGGGIVNNRGSYSLIISESGSEISGSGNANLSVLLGGNNNKIISNYAAYGSVIMGVSNTITSTTKIATYNRILGISNTITDAYYCNILGVSNNITASGAYTGYYNDIIGNNNNITTTVETSYGHKIIGSENTVDSGGYVKILGRYCNNGGYTGVMLLSDGGTSTLTATANNEFNARFTNGYRFMKNGSTRFMNIASNGYVTIDTIPTAASATDILVSNGGVVSTRTVASLGIPVITPSALTKTDDTNVTISLGGTPATALLQGVSLTLGWNGVLAISRGGTGLGTLGTANQLLRVNSSATALEYFTPDWTSNTGTVTSFSAGNLSPLFTTNVATPTTTPALSFNLSNCNQYQVFGRVVAGTGAPSYVSLNPIAFNGLAIPNREVVFGTGTGVSSSSGFKYTTLGSVQIGTGTATGTYSFQMGAGSVASNYTMNIGGSVVNNKGNYSLIISESGSEISGSGNANLAVLIGGNNNKIIAGTDAYGNVIMGASNTVTSTTGITIYNRILGNDNTITDAYYNNILGISNNISRSGAYSAYYNDIIGYSNSISGTTSNAYHNKIIGVNNTISNGGYNNLIGRYCNNGGYSGVLILADGNASTMTANASNQFNARFYGGYRFMKDGSTQWMAIAPTTGYVTINNIPTAASATDILVSNGGVVSTRTVASLGIGGSAVWYIQGTATDATTNAQDIVRTGKVRIGASGTSTYMLSVVGNAYIMNGVEINNNQSYKGFNTSATAVNLIKINSSNYIEVGQSTYDIYLPNYTSSRSADTVSTSDKYLYVNSSGYLKADSAKWVRNDGGTAYISSTESHAADSTYRRVTFDTVELGDDTFYTISGSSGDYRITFPSGYQLHYVVVTLEYTTSGTPTVTADIRRSAVAMETNISTSDDSRKVMTIHTTMVVTGGSGDYATVYLKVSGSAITLQKCRLTVIPLGIVRV